MYAIAIRIADKLTSLRRSNRHRREEDDQLSTTGYSRQSTPLLVPLERPLATRPTINISSINEGNSAHNNSDNSTLSLLYNLAKSWAWPALAHRCQTHPWEASWKIVNRDGDTALHWAVFGNPPLYVVKALLKACPNLVNTANNAQQLPLHLACCYRASSEILHSLIEASPRTAGIRNGLGYYPLHLLCDCGCRPASLEVMLRYPDAVRTVTEKDYTYGRTPIYILNQRKNLGAFAGYVVQLRNLRQRQQDGIQCGNWTEEDQGKLQETISMVCSCSMERKENQWLVLEILNVNPEAARIRECNGRFPLEIFVSSFRGASIEWSEALKRLILAHPVALANLHIDTHIYPLILDRIGCSKETRSEIFELLKASPSLFSHFATHESRRES
jgi:hypothetical protein